MSSRLGISLARFTLAIAIGLIASTFPLVPASASPTHYVEMSDGVLIAVNVRMPKDFEKGKTYPTIFEMSGYDGGSADGQEPTGGAGSRGLTEMFESNYVTIHASVRGTGCSGGEFDLFSWRSAIDGRELIEWINDQPWSNGKIGIYGHSYGGLTGFMVAATRPPSLDAASLSGLIDDLYRGIVYLGGVSNYGFPLLWTGGVRPVYDVGGGTFDGLDNGDPRCAEAMQTRGRTVLNDPILQGIQDTDNTWMQVRSLINYVERVEVPIHITGAYQDEQTGPRGPYHLFEEVGANPKRLLMTNGVHGTQTGPKEVWSDRLAWMDHWLRGVGEAYPRSSVTALLEMTDEGSRGRIDSRSFPLEQTKWTNLYLHQEGVLDANAPKEDEGSDVYFSGSGRQSWSYQAGHEAGSPMTTESGPDEVTYATKPFKDATAIVGPSMATLYVSSSAPDTELFVQLIDEAPDGSRYYVQRGMLKASHRAIIKGLSDYDHGRMYRPHRPHTNPTLIEPGRVYKYQVEVFPLGHVFRTGHRLVVKIHQPPTVDSYYVYVPNKRLMGINTVFHDRKHPSSLMLPFVPLDGVDLGPAPHSCALTGIRCVS